MTDSVSFMSALFAARPLRPTLTEQEGEALTLRVAEAIAGAGFVTPRAEARARRVVAVLVAEGLIAVPAGEVEP